MLLEYLPKGSPEYDAVEEYWRQGKDDLLVSKNYPKFPNLKGAIANYYSELMLLSFSQLIINLKTI